MDDCASGIFLLAVLGAPAACSTPERRRFALLTGCGLAVGVHWALVSLRKRNLALRERLEWLKGELAVVRKLLGNGQCEEQRPGLRHGSGKWNGLRPDPLGSDAQPGLRAWSLAELPAGWRSKLQATRRELAQVDQLRHRLEQDSQKFTRVRRDELVLLRFLRARKGNVDAAEAMFRNAARLQTAVDAIGMVAGERAAAARRLDAYWKVHGLMGLDRQNDPILWERQGRTHVPTLVRLAETFEQTERFEYYTCESLLAAVEEEMWRQDRPILGYTVVADLTGLCREHLNARGLALGRHIARIDQDCYPELVKRVILINAPWIFPAVWKIVQHFLDADTREKVEVVPKDQTLEVLLQYIPENSIPAALGGKLCIRGDCECNLIIPPGGPIPDDVITGFKF